MGRAFAYREKLAVVTGAASGIGAALCRELAGRGAEVVAIDRDALGTETLVAQIDAGGEKAGAVTLDVRDGGAIEKALQEIASRHGRLDLVFNNAGLGCWGDAREFSADAWREIIDVNFWGCVHGSLAAYRWMAEHRGGCIVNTASLAGLIPVPGAAPYSAAKHAVVGFSLALRAEAETLGVQVNVACPGPVASQFHTSLLRSGDAMPGRAPPGEMIDTEQAAQEILRGVERNDALIVFPARARRTWWKWRTSPGWLQGAQRAIVANLRRESR